MHSRHSKPFRMSQPCLHFPLLVSFYEFFVVAHCLFQPCIKWEFHCSTRLEYGFSSCVRFFSSFLSFILSVGIRHFAFKHINSRLMFIQLYLRIHFNLHLFISHRMTMPFGHTAICNEWYFIYIGRFLLLHQCDHLSQVLMNCVRNSTSIFILDMTSLSQCWIFFSFVFDRSIFNSN